MIQVIVKAVEGSETVDKVIKAIEEALDKVVPEIGEDIIMDQHGVKQADAFLWSLGVLGGQAQATTDKYLMPDGSYHVETKSKDVKES